MNRYASCDSIETLICKTQLCCIYGLQHANIINTQTVCECYYMPHHFMSHMSNNIALSCMVYTRAPKNTGAPLPWCFGALAPVSSIFLELTDRRMAKQRHAHKAKRFPRTRRTRVFQRWSHWLRKVWSNGHGVVQARPKCSATWAFADVGSNNGLA